MFSKYDLQRALGGCIGCIEGTKNYLRNNSHARCKLDLILLKRVQTQYWIIKIRARSGQFMLAQKRTHKSTKSTSFWFRGKWQIKVMSKRPNLTTEGVWTNCSTSNFKMFKMPRCLFVLSSEGTKKGKHSKGCEFGPLPIIIWISVLIYYPTFQQAV